MRCIHEVRRRQGSMALVWLPSQKTRQDFQQGPTVQSCFLGKWKQNSPWPRGGSPYSCQAKIKHVSQWQYRPRLALQMSVLVVLFLFYSSIGPSGLQFVERVERKSSFIELVLKEIFIQVLYSIFPSTKGCLFLPIATSPSFLVASQPHPTKPFVCPMSGSRSNGPAMGHWCWADILQAQNKVCLQDY